MATGGISVRTIRPWTKSGCGKGGGRAARKISSI